MTFHSQTLSLPLAVPASLGPDRLMLSVLTAAAALWLPDQLLLLPPPTCWSEAGKASRD